jgi:NAD(P)-dependent dehydrogenase (short-subunit alcohol dehydrogenase family)
MAERSKGAKDSLAGKVALVTGASSGIGLAVAEKLVDLGARVAMVARRRTTLEGHVARLGSDRAAAFAADVTDLDALTSLPLRVIAQFGRLDILVNNAGLNHRGPILRFSPQELRDIITTNLTAPVVLTRAAVDKIEKGGAIVNVASIAGMIPVPHEAAYSASKAGLRAFTRSMREEFPELHVATVCPGPVDTGFFGEISEVPNLVFSQPMSSAVVACILGNQAEIVVPSLSGKLATVGYVFPAIAALLRPILERRGAAAKASYAERKRTSS